MTRNDIAKSLKPEDWIFHPFDNIEYCKITDIHEAVLKIKARGINIVEIYKEGTTIPLCCYTGGVSELKKRIRMWRVDYYSEAFNII